MAGSHGCLPDYNEIYETYSEATEAMLNEYHTMKDMEVYKPGMIKGSYKTGYYEINPVLGWQYMEVSSCDMDDCIEKPDIVIESITVIGKRWFDKIYGNTYHTANILVNGDIVGNIPFNYGYGDMYIQNASKWLQDHKYIESDRDYIPLSVYCRENGIVYHSFVTDVTRKKDL